MTSFDERDVLRPRRRLFVQGVVGAAAAVCLPISRRARGQRTGSPRPAAVAPPTVDSRGASASAHFPFGPVIPSVALPAWPLRTHEDKTVDSNALFKGRVTALQLMFTGCSATCPIQGAIFAAAQRQLGPDHGDARFLSLSIDPLADTPRALSAWLKQFEARPGWTAAAPRREDLDQIRLLMRGDYVAGNSTEPRPTDAHSAQVYLIDRQARLVHRSADFPPVQKIVENLRRLSAQA